MNACEYDELNHGTQLIEYAYEYARGRFV